MKRVTKACAALAATALAMIALPAAAQVGSVSDDDIKDAPPQFRSDLSHGRIKPSDSELVRQNIEGAPPSADPRDFNGMYNFLRKPMPRPGGGGPGGGGGSPGGPPPGGRPGGPSPGGPGTAAANGGPRPSSVGAGACVISGFPGLTSYSTTILIDPRQVAFLMEENHLLRWAPFAERHDPAAVPSFGGDSIARWDGNTLVIDTTQVRTRGVATLGHYVERFTKQPDGNIAIDRFQVADDGTQKPVEQVTLRWRPDLHYVEDICEDLGEAFGVGYK